MTEIIFARGPAARARALALGLFAAAAIVAAPAVGFGQEAETIRGMIVSHEENSVVVRTTMGDRTVRLDPGAKIVGTQGQGVLRREERQASDLIRGLAVTVKATPSGDGLVASEVVFKTSDLKTARQIDAGIQSTEDRVSANREAIARQEERLNNVGNLVAAGRTKVFFPVGGYQVPQDAKLELCELAEKAKAMKGGFRLAVVGRADPTGNPEANKRLSARRALAVKTFLLEHCAVMPGNFVPPTALGESPIFQDPDPPMSDREARRVTVTIMISKANAPA